MNWIAFWSIILGTSSFVSGIALLWSVTESDGSSAKYWGLIFLASVVGIAVLAGRTLK